MKASAEHIEKAAPEQETTKLELNEFGIPVNSVYKTNSAAASDDQNPYAHILANFGKELGHDFSNVNIYQNAAAANQLGAEAFTEGNNIHLSSLSSNYSTAQKAELLQHELVHVIQQRQNRVSDGNRAELEQEANNPTQYALRLRNNPGKRQRQRTKQFRFYEITAEEITEIRQLLQLKLPLVAYKKLLKRISVNEALKKFLADYPDIASGLLQQLDPIDNKKQYKRIAGLFSIPEQGIDQNSEKALVTFKKTHSILDLNEVSKKNELELKDVLSEAGLTGIEAEKDVVNLILKLEAKKAVLQKKWENYDELIEDLELYALTYRIEQQADNDKNIRDAKNESYFGFGTREYYLLYPLFGIYPAMRKNYRKSPKKERNGDLLPSQFGLLSIFLGADKLIGGDALKFKGLRMQDVESVKHWTGFSGASFDKDAIIDELTVDRKQMTITIKAKKLPIDFLKMETANEGGIYADQINLNNASITLSLHKLGANSKSNQTVKKKETSHAKVHMEGDLDIFNLRLVSKNETTGVGRISIPGLSLCYEQDISERKTFNIYVNSSIGSQLGVLTSMLLKGPMLMQPLFYGLINLFTVDMKKATDKNYLAMQRLLTLEKELKGKPQNAKSFLEALERTTVQEKLSNPDFLAYDAQRKSHQAAFADMLSENLELTLNYNEIKINHVFMTDSNLSQEAITEGRLPYIKEVKIGANQSGDGAPEMSVKTQSLTEDDIKKALESELRFGLSQDARSLISKITEDEKPFEEYQKLVRESHHSRSKTKDRHKAIVEAAAYFEFFRKTDFNLNSSAGHIQGGNMVADLALPKLVEMMAASGLKIQGATGIENITYKNLKIGITEHAQGWEAEKDKYNGISIDLVIPKLTAQQIDYNQGGIVLNGKDLQLDKLTVGVAMTFNEMKAESPYNLSLSAIEIEKAEINNTYFNYPASELSFSSAKTVANNIYFKMTPTMAPEMLELNIKRIGLSEAQVNFGPHQILSEKGKDIILENTSFYQDSNEMRFAIGGYKMAAAYSDGEFSHVNFDMHRPNNGDPFFEYQKIGNDYQRFNMRYEGALKLPEFCFKLGNDKYIQTAEAELEGIGMDLELVGDDVYLNEAHIDCFYAPNYSFSDNIRTFSSDKPLKLTGLKIDNIRLETKSWLSQSGIWNQPHNTNISIPATESLYNATDSHPYLNQTQDLTSVPNDKPLKTDKTLLSHGHHSDKASIKVESFSTSNLELDEKGKKLKLMIDLFSFNKLSAYNLSDGKFGIDELDKMFAHREVEDFNLVGKVEYLNGKQQEIKAGWDTRSKTGEKLISVYDAETNYTSFENIPITDLWLNQLNVKVGDIQISSKEHEKFPSRVEDINFNGLRINHNTGELEFDEVTIRQISANGLSVKSNALGWGFDAGIDQRASVNEIVLKGWKTKLNNPSDFGAMGKKGTLDIKSVLIPKISATLQGKNDAKGTTSTSGSIGKIRYVYHKSGAQSLSIKDLLFSNSEFKFTENSEFVNNFLKQVSAKEVFIELDAAGHKSLLLKDAIISGYKFEMNNMSLQADLHCTGDLRIYEGDYDAFVSAMPEAIKSGKTGERISSKNHNAWLIDAAGCQVKMENINIIKEDWLTGQTNEQKVMEENGFYRHLSPQQGGPQMAWSVNEDNADWVLQNWRTTLYNQGSKKREQAMQFVKENDRYYESAQMFNNANAEIYLRLGEAYNSITIKDGKIDLHVLKAELITILREAIGGLTLNQLPNNQDLRNAAREILTYLKAGSFGDGIVAGFAIGTFLGLLLGAIFGFLGPAGVGLGMSVGFLIGVFAGIILGPILIEVAKWYFSHIVGNLKDLCQKIIDNDDYREPLFNILELAVNHLDIIKENETPYLVFRLDNKKHANSKASWYDHPLFPLGERHDTHVDYDKKTIGISGLLKHVMKQQVDNGAIEMGLVDRIDKMKKEGVSSERILENLYNPPRQQQSGPFRLRGIGGWLNGDGFVSGGDELNPIMRRTIQNLLSGNLAMFVNVSKIDLTNLAHTLSFNNENMKLHFFNSDKTRVSSFTKLNDEQGLAADNIQGQFSMSPASGFVLESENKNTFAFGDFQLPHLKFSSGLDPKNMNKNIMELNSTFPATANGFQMAFRKEEKDKPTVNAPQKPFESLGVKYPHGSPTFERVDKKNPWLLFEFSELTGIDLTHVYILNGDTYWQGGDIWQGDFLLKENIKWGARIGFVREADDQNNKIENYIGTLYSNGFEQSREFVPFRGKKTKK